MYASNEHEFQQEGDWIFLHETPSSTNVCHSFIYSSFILFFFLNI